MGVFNGASTVERAITSILKQTYGRFEFIIVDDGSTDGTADLIRTFSDERIRLLTIPHQGLASALNAGLEKAQGSYIARQDADDVSSPSRLEKQIEFLQRFPAIGYVGTGIDTVTNTGKKLCTYIYPAEPESIRRLMDGMLNPLAHGSLMFRTEILRGVSGYDTFFSRSEDYDLHLRLLEFTDASNLREPLLHYEVSLDSMQYNDASVDTIKYSMFARVLAGRRRGEWKQLSEYSKERLYEVFSMWYERENLSKLHRAARLRRASWLSWGSASWVRALAYAIKAMRLDPQAVAARIFGSQYLMWNPRRSHSFTTFVDGACQSESNNELSQC